MTDNSEIIDLLTAIVSTIESQDEKANKAKFELLEQLKIIASKTDTVSTNFPKLIETLSNFDSKIASSFDDIQNVSKQLNSVVQQISVAQKALERNTGARGLRSIVEAALLDTMYDLPSMEDVEKVVIDESVIGGQSKPLLIYGKPEAQQASGE